MALRRRSLGVLTAVLLALSGPAAAAEFLPGVEDMPLMPGLVAAPDATTVFDTPAGRIVQAEARAAGGTETEVRRFYGETLPALGWRAVDARSFEREGERLLISVTRRAAGGISVRFDIRPR